MKYVGIDLHKNTIAVCVMNRERKVLERRQLYCTDVPAIEEYFAGLGDFEYVVEATASYEWLAELLEPLAKRGLLAHPGKLRPIAETKNKSDKLDAQVLAEFLALEMIPQAFRPPKRQRQHRALVRCREEIVHRRTSLRARIRHMLADHNLDRPDLFGSAGLEWLAQVELPPEERFVLDRRLAQWRFEGEQLEAVDKRLKKFASSAATKERETRAVLKSVPGVGTVVADVAVSEIGDIRRFSNNKKVSAYAGLSPGRRESGGRAKDVGITKQGSKLLRWAMVEAAWQAVRCTNRWKTIYEGLKKRKGPKQAIVAVARRLLEVMASVWRSGQPYRHDHAPPRGPSTRATFATPEEMADPAYEF